MTTAQRFFILVCLACISQHAFTQVYTNKEVGKKNAVLVDSIEKKEWPYALPIMGKKATAKGFNLPYPAGVSAQYFWQQSDLVIDNLQVGFNNGQKYELDAVNADSWAPGPSFFSDCNTGLVCKGELFIHEF